jgi:hypothetical protein
MADSAASASTNAMPASNPIGSLACPARFPPRATSLGSQKGSGLEADWLSLSEPTQYHRHGDGADSQPKRDEKPEHAPGCAVVRVARVANSRHGWGKTIKLKRPATDGKIRTEYFPRMRLRLAWGAGRFGFPAVEGGFWRKSAFGRSAALPSQ